jgi:hypothetical protein
MTAGHRPLEPAEPTPTRCGRLSNRIVQVKETDRWEWSRAEGVGAMAGIGQRQASMDIEESEPSGMVGGAANMGFERAPASILS